MSGAPESTIIVRVVRKLTSAGITPVLVGGIAMVVYGSSRATRDCDLAVKKTEEAIRKAVRSMYEEGFGLIFDWNEEKFRPNKVEKDLQLAMGWAGVELPESLWFWSNEDEVRVDLVLDIPLEFDELQESAEKRVIEGTRILVASPAALKCMKEAALRSNPNRITDEQDLLFLKRLLEK